MSSDDLDSTIRDIRRAIFEPRTPMSAAHAWAGRVTVSVEARDAELVVRVPLRD